MVKGYINALLERSNTSVYSALVLDMDNVHSLIRDTSSNTYTDASQNDPYNIDKLATDALFDATDRATWNDWNTAFGDLLSHANDASENALILENFVGDVADPLFQNTRFYYKLFVKIMWNGIEDTNMPKANHNIATDLDNQIKKINFNSTTLDNMGVTLYKSETDVATDDDDVIHYSLGSVLIKFNVDLTLNSFYIGVK